MLPNKSGGGSQVGSRPESTRNIRTYVAVCGNKRGNPQVVGMSMIVIMNDTATIQQTQSVAERINNMGLTVDRTTCAGFTILGGVGGLREGDINLVALLPGVHSVKPMGGALAVASMRRTAEDYCDFFRLSPRQREIVRLFLDGYSNKDIANRWGISLWTVKEHIRNLYRKVGIHQRAALVAHVLQLGTN